MRFATFIAAAVGVAVMSSTAVIASDVVSLAGEKTAQGTAAEQCLKDLQAFEKELEKVGFGVMRPGGYGSSAPSGYFFWGTEGTPRQKIRSLREAAYVYRQGGNEQLCQTVLASMRQLYEQHQKPVGTD